MLSEHLDKNNLHHAYLIEGGKDELIPGVLIFLKSLEIKTSSNPDFISMSTDSFKIEDARNLKAMSAQRQISSSKKIFLISTNSFQLEAQNALLKLFEEPIENTHFFVITPDSNALIKTFVSRFYFISTKQNLVEEQADAEKFLSMHLSQRVEFIKSLLVEPEDEILDESTRRKALKFLNELERVLHGKFTKAKLYSKESTDFFNQIFKAREFLRQPGSSAKSLMESVALCVPVL